MDEITGIELLESLVDPPHVILTTAYEKYAIKGYELQIVDYLLKPFRLEVVEESVKRAIERDRTAF